MEGLAKVDVKAYAEAMQAECRRILEQVAEAVNNAPDGRVISGSEMEVRDLLAELRQKAFEKAVQMRVDSTESTFSPGRPAGEGAAGQGPGQPQHALRQRADQLDAAPLQRRGRGQRPSGGPAAG